MNKKKRDFFIRIIEDIQFFKAYYKERGSKSVISLSEYYHYTSKELLNVVLYNIGAFLLNIELLFVSALMFYTMQNTLYMILNCGFAVILLLSSVYVLYHLIILQSVYHIRIYEQKKEENKL